MQNRTSDWIRQTSQLAREEDQQLQDDDDVCLALRLITTSHLQRQTAAAVAQQEGHRRSIHLTPRLVELSVATPRVSRQSFQQRDENPGHRASDASLMGGQRYNTNLLEGASSRTPPWPTRSSEAWDEVPCEASLASDGGQQQHMSQPMDEDHGAYAVVQIGASKAATRPDAEDAGKDLLHADSGVGSASVGASDGASYTAGNDEDTLSEAGADHTDDLVVDARWVDFLHRRSSTLNNNPNPSTLNLALVYQTHAVAVSVLGVEPIQQAGNTTTKLPCLLAPLEQTTERTATFSRKGGHPRGR